jgi:Clostridium epsilon toxin ETX/Bacillus mosquitocidal toxin MTX2
MTFHFGAPYFIKDIDYDLAALEAARGKTAPEVVATQDIANRTSREQSSEYTRDLEVEKTTTLTFEQSFGLTFGAKLSVEVGAGLKGVASANAQTELSWEVSSSAKSGREYKNSRREKASWRVPVSVPPGKKIVATSTWRKYKVNIPFTYTVAWYEGTMDNIKKEVILPGVYNDTRVEDLKHEFKEAPLD